MNLESAKFARAVLSCGRGAARAGAAALLTTLAGCGFGGSSSPTAVDVPTSAAIADVNGDGVPDLLMATVHDQGSGANPGFASVILGNKSAPGTFQSGAHYGTTGTDPSSIAAADLTGSGGIDLVVANFASGSVSVFMHDAANPGRFQAAVDVPTGGQPNQVVIGDLNGDGKPDLALADLSSNGNAVIVFQDPANPGRFLAPVNLSTGHITTAVAIGDLNGDGKPDVVAANFDTNGNNGRVSVFLQDPANPGKFLARVDFAAGGQPQAVKIVDLNGDGLPDLVVANRRPGADGTGSSGVSVLLQDPAQPGTFRAPVTYATQAASVDVAVADLNGDGKPDLAVANLGPAPTGSVSVLLQDSARPGVFLTASSYAGFGEPLGVVIADLNGDGLPDIALADATSATVMLQIPTAPGTFAAAVPVGN